MGSPPDNQLPFVSCRRASNERIGLEHADRLDDFADSRGRVLDVVLSKVIENTLDIVTETGREFDARHSLTRQLLGCRPARFLACDPALQVGAHLAPGNRLSSGDDRGISLLGDVVKVAAAFRFLGLFSYGFQDEIVCRRAGPLGLRGHAGLELIG